MARVLIPVTPRQYNYNPRGSSTTQVLMRADNPFERSATVVKSKFQQRGTMLPGMGTLGDDTSGTPIAPAPTAAPASPWAAIAQGAVGVAQQVAAAHYAPKPNSPLAIATGMQYLPIGQQLPKPKSKLPWIIGGVAGVAGIGILIMMLKKH